MWYHVIAVLFSSPVNTSQHCPRSLCFGKTRSFSAEGWGAALADAYQRRADVLNRGYSGHSAAWRMTDVCLWFVMLSHVSNDRRRKEPLNSIHRCAAEGYNTRWCLEMLRHHGGGEFHNGMNCRGTRAKREKTKVSKPDSHYNHYIWELFPTSAENNLKIITWNKNLILSPTSWWSRHHIAGCCRHHGRRWSRRHHSTGDDFPGSQRRVIGGGESGTACFSEADVVDLCHLNSLIATNWIMQFRGTKTNFMKFAGIFAHPWKWDHFS